MTSITVENVPDEMRPAIQVDAAQHLQDIEAEMHGIDGAAVKPDARIKLGSLFAKIGR